MRTLLIAGILLLTSGFARCSPDSPPEGKLVHAEALVLDVESRAWVSNFGRIYSGDAVIVFKIIQPTMYKGAVLKLGLSSSNEMRVGNERLAKGVRFSFTTSEEVLKDEGVMPEVFSMLVSNVKILPQKDTSLSGQKSTEGTQAAPVAPAAESR